MRATVVLAAGFGCFLLLQLSGMGTVGFVVVIPLTLVIMAVISFTIAGRSVAQYADRKSVV